MIAIPPPLLACLYVDAFLRIRCPLDLSTRLTPVLRRSTCRHYDVECLSQTQRVVFMALAHDNSGPVFRVEMVRQASQQVPSRRANYGQQPGNRLGSSGRQHNSWTIVELSGVPDMVSKVPQEVWFRRVQPSRQLGHRLGSSALQRARAGNSRPDFCVDMVRRGSQEVASRRAHSAQQPGQGKDLAVPHGSTTVGQFLT